jgi:hypothetical protein
MADYHPLISRAVASLDKNTGENRRALYERARTALVAQLRGVVPPLDESEITRERLALEEAIRKVEAESARHAREIARPAFIKRTAEAPRRDEPRGDEPRAEEAGRGEEREGPQRDEVQHQEQRNQAPARAAPSSPQSKTDLSPQPSAGPSQAAGSRSSVGSPRTGKMPRTESPTSPSAGHKPPESRHPPEGRRSLADEAMKGYRDVVSDRGAAARAAREAHGKEAGLPPAPSLPPVPEHPLRDLGQLEPQMQPENLWAPPFDGSRSASPPGHGPSHAPATPRSGPDDPQETIERPRAPRRSYGRIIRLAFIALLVLAAGGIAYWQHEAIGEAVTSVASMLRAPGTTPRDVTPPARTKIPDRIGQPTTQPSPGPAVAQRVVLYEEDPEDPQGRRFVGTVVWRTETRPASPGRPPELMVRADIEVPDRKMTASWSLRRNTDQSLPASHTIEIMFNLPPDSPSGGVQNVPGVLMKQAEQTRGVPLAGLAVKVTPGFFLIGLSALETDMQRNLQLLKDRSWFDIPIVYNNNRRAILAMEKGTPGERAFAEAFVAWRQ